MKLLLLLVLFAAFVFGQTATCTPYYINGQLSGDHCAIQLAVPTPGSVVIYWVSGTIDPASGNVTPWALPLDFHGSKSLSYAGPSVGSITYNGVAIYTRP